MVNTNNIQIEDSIKQSSKIIEEKSNSKYDKKAIVIKIFKYAFYGISIIAALYIMVNHIGIISDLDFGAGAYYYADIPNFQKYVNGDHYTSPVPMWVLIVLFLVWGRIMYKAWVWLDKKLSDK